MKITEINTENEYEEMLIKDVDFVNSACETFKNSDNVDAYEYMNNIRYYPKCAIRSAMQFFECDKGKVTALFNKLNWSHKCKHYNLEEIYNIEKYINCNGATHRLSDGSMKNFYFGNNIEAARANYIKYGNELCYDPTVFHKFQCAAFELRDECANVKDCYGDLKVKWNKNCTNPNLKPQLKESRWILYDTPNFASNEKEAVFNRHLIADYDNLDKPLDLNNVRRRLQGFGEETNQSSTAAILIFSGLSLTSYFIYKSKITTRRSYKAVIITACAFLGYLLFQIIN